jgi:hypothetical protein
VLSKRLSACGRALHATIRSSGRVLQRIHCTKQVIGTRALGQRRMEMKIHAEAACRGATRKQAHEQGYG